jgi:hypothetical protein
MSRTGHKTNKQVAKEQDWAEVKRRCHMTDEGIKMARELGFAPRTLLSSQASLRSEPWKAPVEEWVRSLYEKQAAKRLKKAERKAKLAAKAGQTTTGENQFAGGGTAAAITAEIDQPEW